MRKYFLMLAGLVGVSVLGGIGVVYSLVHSAPMHVSRIDLESKTPVAEARGDTAFAGGAAPETITVH